MQCDINSDTSFATLGFCLKSINSKQGKEHKEHTSLFGWLVASSLLWSPRFIPGSVHVEFVVDKMALGQLLSKFFSFPLSGLYADII
jgi:hypothetical protein